MTEQMQIKAIAPWFGAKRNMAPRIVEQVGDHRVYWEPFCGSMAVLFQKPPCAMETVSDLHADLTNLARVICDGRAGPALYRRLRRTLTVEEIFEESAARVRQDYEGEFDPQRAYDYFVVVWLGRNGLAGTSSCNYHFCVRYSARGGHAAKRWRSAADSIPAWRRRMRNVTILRRDAFELLPRIEDRRGTAIYVDPPYITSGARYVHDFGKNESALAQHRRLAEALGRFRNARVVVSYYAHPFLDELYPQPAWTHCSHRVSKSLAAFGQRGTNDVRATELLILNGPSYAAGGERLFS